MKIPRNSIPPREHLEPYYEKWELETFDTFRPQINSIANEYQRGEVGRRLLRKMWGDELLYISKTSWISTKEEGAKLLVPNYAQQRFYKDVIQRCRAEAVPIRGIVLKARQLGFSTFIQAWQYEQCARNAHRNSLTISYDADSTTVMFQKARFIHQRQWFPMPLSRKAREGIEMEEPHGSNFYTETAGNERAGRSYTVHHLHCSEVPMWMDDGEVLNAAHQSVPASNTHSSIFHESTAKGAVGSFYDLWDKATKSESNFIPFFAPWFWDPGYTLRFRDDDAKNLFMRSLLPEDQEYMNRYRLSPEQMHWRAFKTSDDCQGNRKKFQQEYPADAEEAFLTTGQPVFDPLMVSRLSRQARDPLFTGDIMLVKETA